MTIINHLRDWLSATQEWLRRYNRCTTAPGTAEAAELTALLNRAMTRGPADPLWRELASLLEWWRQPGRPAS